MAGGGVKFYGDFCFCFIFWSEKNFHKPKNGCGGCVCIHEHFGLVFGLMVFVLFLSGFQVSVKDLAMFFPFRLSRPTCDV